MESSVLMASGTMVPKEWKTMARERAQFLEGIANYNDDGLDVFDEGAMLAEEATLEQKFVYFPGGSTEVDSTQQSALRDIFLSLEVLLDQAKIGHKNLSVSVFGHSTVGQTEQENIRISSWRADAVVSELIRLGIEPQGEIIQPIGMGTQSLPQIDLAARGVPTDSSRIPQFNSVTFMVVIEGRNWD